MTLSLISIFEKPYVNKGSCLWIPLLLPFELQHIIVDASIATTMGGPVTTRLRPRLINSAYSLDRILKDARLAKDRIRSTFQYLLALFIPPCELSARLVGRDPEMTR